MQFGDGVGCSGGGVWRSIKSGLVTRHRSAPLRGSSGAVVSRLEAATAGGGVGGEGGRGSPKPLWQQWFCQQGRRLAGSAGPSVFLKSAPNRRQQATSDVALGGAGGSGGTRLKDGLVAEGAERVVVPHYLHCKIGASMHSEQRRSAWEAGAVSPHHRWCAAGTGVATPRQRPCRPGPESSASWSCGCPRAPGGRQSRVPARARFWCTGRSSGSTACGAARPSAGRGQADALPQAHSGCNCLPAPPQLQPCSRCGTVRRCCAPPACMPKLALKAPHQHQAPDRSCNQHPPRRLVISTPCPQSTHQGAL